MRSILAAAVLACAALVLFGAASTPHFLADRAGWIGLAAMLGVLAAYGVAIATGLTPTRRISPAVLAWAWPLGLAAGAVYAAEIGLEHAIPPTDNTVWGLVEFGLVLGLFAASGAAVAWRTRRARPTVLAGVWTAVISALIWYAVLLAMFYAFRGSAREAAVLRAEGDLDDFRRSGLKDFQVFLMGDFLGAGFFHLVLSPIAGALLAGAGGLAAAATRRIGALVGAGGAPR